MTLTINYAAGHDDFKNAFRMAFSCETATGTNLAANIEAANATLTGTTHGCTGTVGGKAVTYADPNSTAKGGITSPFPYPNTMAPTRSPNYGTSAG